MALKCLCLNLFLIRFLNIIKIINTWKLLAHVGVWKFWKIFRWGMKIWREIWMGYELFGEKNIFPSALDLGINNDQSFIPYPSLHRLFLYFYVVYGKDNEFYLLNVCIWCHQNHSFVSWVQFIQNFVNRKTVSYVFLPNFDLLRSTVEKLWAAEVHKVLVAFI